MNGDVKIGACMLGKMSEIVEFRKKNNPHCSLVNEDPWEKVKEVIELRPLTGT